MTEKAFPAVDQLIAETHGLMEYWAQVQRRRPKDDTPLLDIEIIKGHFSAHAEKIANTPGLTGEQLKAALDELERELARTIAEAQRINQQLPR